ncbi:acyl-CoA dehydrogenase family protein [Gordonia soli]|uniref:Putative acyl-CoA dehydrogenase n=1 Tax=Gordonia soli NBRC 108243 TaxID=1223545 RepID=M0QIL1_9ACTN|nr:acyl-CoA dehydrogenase family protein [Gordonia soli]GAC68450.1 putative acyl-CoA dehydrogenase [Gordonia soli NBRC 108243]
MTAPTLISAEERDALRESVGDLLRKRSDPAAVRAAIGSTPRMDRELWSTLCNDIGIAALPIPDEHGGAGASFVESAVVLEQLGATLSPVPALSTALATATVLIADDAAATDRLLPAIASGEQIVTVAWADSSGWRRPGVRAEAGLLSGTAHFVTDAEAAGTILVLAAGTDGTTLHEVDTRADGVTVTPLPTVDPTRPLSRVDFDDTPATTIPAPDDLTDRLRTHAFALLSAEQVGGARRALELTVDHTTSRVQFGRTIGSFQALKHRMADMFAAVETSASISAAAVEAVVVGRSDASELAAAAHVHCSESFSRVTGDAIQLHGGIGITWEHDIQLYFKRAHGSSQFFGQPHEVVRSLSRTVLA